MEPKYHNGDMVLVSRIPDAPDLQLGEVGAFIVGNETCIKVYGEEGLESLNPKYQPLSFGDMPMPADFRYKEIFLRGKPCHSKIDDFRIRHPSMDMGKRAKIFAPFDALKGFNEAVAAKDELYEDRRELNEEDISELNRRIEILHRLTANSRMARENHIRITVTYYVPCEDSNSESYGLRGQYQSLTGICRKVDHTVSRCLLVDERKIRFRDIYRIENEDGVFDEMTEA